MFPPPTGGLKEPNRPYNPYSFSQLHWSHGRISRHASNRDLPLPDDILRSIDAVHRGRRGALWIGDPPRGASSGMGSSSGVRDWIIVSSTITPIRSNQTPTWIPTRIWMKSRSEYTLLFQNKHHVIVYCFSCTSQHISPIHLCEGQSISPRVSV